MKTLPDVIASHDYATRSLYSLLSNITGLYH